MEQNGTKSSSSSKKNTSSGKKKSGSAIAFTEFLIHLGEAMKRTGLDLVIPMRVRTRNFYLGTKVQRSSLGLMKK